jgi:hypothetical protein
MCREWQLCVSLSLKTKQKNNPFVFFLRFLFLYFVALYGFVFKAKFYFSIFKEHNYLNRPPPACVSHIKHDDRENERIELTAQLQV